MPGNDTRAAKNRRIRQEAIREQLEAGGHIQYAVELVKKIEQSADPFEVSKYKAAFDARMKLINKYLPELKATELTGEGGGPAVINFIKDFGD